VPALAGVARLTTPQFVSEKDLEAITGVRVRTSQKHRLFNRGPRWYKIGGSLRYRLDEVLAWIEGNVAGGEASPQPLTPHANKIR